jgi:hypothetical protein
MSSQKKIIGVIVKDILPFKTLQTLWLKLAIKNWNKANTHLVGNHRQWFFIHYLAKLSILIGR